MKRRFFLKLAGLFATAPVVAKTVEVKNKTFEDYSLSKIAEDNKIKMEKERKKYLLPDNRYLAKIIKTKIEPTKAGNGQRLKLTFKILNGMHKDRKVYTNLILVHPNPLAVEFSMKELSQITKACKLETIKDADELLNIYMIINVSAKPNYYSENPSYNFIKSYSKTN